jgi:hypothetical protein
MPDNASSPAQTVFIAITIAESKPHREAKVPQTDFIITDIVEVFTASAETLNVVQSSLIRQAICGCLISDIYHR